MPPFSPFHHQTFNPFICTVLAQMLQPNRTIVTKTGGLIFPCVFCCFQNKKKHKYFLLRVEWYCSSNLLLPSGDNIMPTSADNRPPAHWWTPLNLLPLHLSRTTLSFSSSRSSGPGVKSSGAPKLWPFLFMCEIYSNKLCISFKRTHVVLVGHLCASFEWTLCPSNLNCCNFLHF